jgi:3-oxoacyl-(acyl-carrier-protein) synthase
MASNNDPIVITGCGWVTPFAAGTIGEVLATARDGAARPEPGSGFWAVPDHIRDPYPDLAAEISRDKAAWLTAVALEIVCRDADIEIKDLDAERVGMVLGCALAGQLGMMCFAEEVREQSARFVSPIHFPQTVGNYIAGALARAYDVRGPNATLACGLASGLEALIEGCSLLAAGHADVILAGGVDTLSDELALGLAEPDLTLSEGACLFALERASSARARGARLLAEVKGHTHHARTSPPAPGGPSRVLSAASSPYPGAVFIEHWIGRCFAALGAAAAAAAIGAIRVPEHTDEAAEVPWAITPDRSSVSIGRIALGTPSPISVTAVVFAEADQSHATTLELTV